jgi:hypothetical protein
LRGSLPSPRNWEEEEEEGEDEADERVRKDGIPPNARFPLGPSALAFALNSGGSILVITGPALRDLAVEGLED